MSSLHCTDCTFAKNQIDPSFPLEERDMAGNYGLGYSSDQEASISVLFDIPEVTLEDALSTGSGSDPESVDDVDDPMEWDNPVNEEATYGSSDSDCDGQSDGSDEMEVPNVIRQLRKQLLNGYTLPPHPDQDPQQRTLSRAETLSLKHYLAWTESHGTVKAYNSHAQVLAEATEEENLSLYKVKQLAMDLTGLRPSFVEMCPRSCMAFTGKYQSQSACSYTHAGKGCNELRYRPTQGPRAKPKPRATMLYVPIIPIIQAYYANADTSYQMRHRDNCLKSVLDVLAKGAGKDVKKSEFANSDNHIIHHEELNLFKDKTDTALSISSDGAQLTMKKQSNMWLLIVVLLNLPPEICYKAKNVIIPLAIPGPSAPGNVESFIYPLFEELAQASVGMWTWDAVDSSYFVLRAYLCGVKGDMLGSAKLSGMAGHSAVYGDRFSLVQGARPTDAKGSKFQYYPISPPQKEIHNKYRPIVDMKNLPLRTQIHYWETIKRLESATKSEQKKIVTETGISRLTLCAASPAFSHPSFFPLDPFHLFYENCMPHIWDIWVTHSTEEEVVHMPKSMASDLGEEIEKAMNTLPSSFSGPIRNTHKKRHSQYKIYEWMGLLHWYIIPIAWELGFNKKVLANFAEFVDVIEAAMSHTPKSVEELVAMYNLVRSFLEGFEELYVDEDPEKVTRCRLCIWQLIHIPTHISWNGSIRFGSQATVERAIGEIGHKVRSKKAPFANIATMLFERGNSKVLTLRYPSLTMCPKEGKKKEHLYQSLPIRKAERDSPSEYGHHLATICDHFKIDFNMELELLRWGKCMIPGDITLRSRISEQGGQASRSSRYFEALNLADRKKPIFGEALAFYFVPEHDCSLVVYHQLVKTKQVLGRWCGKWSKDFRVLEASFLLKLIGIWRYQERVHILRRHAGLDMLNAEEGIEEQEEE